MVTILLLIGKFLEFYYKIYHRHRQIVNYLIVGVLTTIVSIVSYNILRFIISNYMICTVLSWVIAVAFAYVTNRKYVFESQEQNILKELSKFVSSRILTLLIEMLIMFLLVDLCGIYDRIAKLVVQVVVTILNYIFSKILVFQKEK